MVLEKPSILEKRASDFDLDVELKHKVLGSRVQNGNACAIAILWE